MKVTIKVKAISLFCVPNVIKKGDWVDLHAGIDCKLNKGNYAMIPLGVCMELPAGYEAIVASRSSLYKKTGLYNPGGIGVIDNSYNGDDDEWIMPVFACRQYTIHKGDRIAQFRIQLSQKATLWQKIKWLFTSGVKIKVVDKLGNENRGGFGSTDEKK